MKRVINIAVKLLFVLAFALPAFAQGTAPAGPATPAKVFIINSDAFYAEKEGISKLTAAIISLNKEFEPRTKELEATAAKLDQLAKDIQNLQAQLQQASGTGAKSPVDPNAIQASIIAKQEEGARLQTEAKRKQEDLKASADRREAAVVTPIRREIGVALTEFSKSRGYSIVFDISKMFENGQVLYLDGTADITEEFIKFFNAKPATTAATTPVKPAGTAAKPN
jgi:Skp family chaperone for outer membrane proteins